MALMQCPECGKEISDAANSCPHCGYPILQSTDKSPVNLGVNVPNPEADAPRNKQSGRKKIIAICAVLVIAIIGIIAGSVIHRNNMERRASEEYQAYLNLAVDSMLKGAADAENCCGLIRDVWYNTIYKESDSKTDKFTKSEYSTSGFNSDFNTSLQSLFQDDNFSASVDAIRDHQSAVEDIMKKLGNPTEQYKEAYSAVLKLYEEYLSLTNMAINPAGSLKTFTADFNKSDSDFMKYYRAAQIYVD